ncbi:proto-oncogene tyrosine-protein kinase ROS-like [Callorhinchus milii]|uniref:proto-oncogene tyrosine-protein kinase ROS-like n=1 Tax=Callorhinchus milii TaxID=7868 RepID=UPI001C3FCAC5|nr:proto-oncogene tyrosine-protein kinase ROS-like [Callorhinchus milii]
MESLSDPQPPVASTIQSSSVLLQWERAGSSAVRYVLQWRYRELLGQWIYTEVVKNTAYNLTELHPYTEYVFRVMWIVTDSQYKYSPESRPYKTKPQGVPSLPPEIVSIESPSPTSVFAQWRKPAFLNGPLIGYHIQLWSDTERFLRDADREQQSYSIYLIKPGTTYRFSIAARNTEGFGPAAITNISTLSQPELSQSLILWLSSNNSLYESKPGDLEEMFCSRVNWITHRITGISGDVRKKELYISEGQNIWVFSLNSWSSFRLVYQSDRLISDLSVDWLYSKLYFVVDQKVLRCDLKNCSTEVVLTLNSSPVKTVVDPFSGYLFIGFSDSLYRRVLPGLDLEADDRDSLLEPLVMNTSLLTFTVNPSFKRVVYINSRGGSVHYIFLDGTEASMDHVLPFDDTTSVRLLALACNLWFLSTGRQVYMAEEHEGSLYPIEVNVKHCFLKDGDFDNLFLWGLSTQPLPVPLHEPTHLQVLLGFNSAAFSWRKPLAAAGLDTSPYILAGTDLGTWKVFLDKFENEIALPNVTNVKDMDWVNNTLYWANSSGVAHITSLAETGSETVVVQGSQNVGALALDWISNTLYWVDNKRNYIFRLPLDADVPVKVRVVVGKVQDLQLDALQGYMYWTTAQTVEYSLMNGKRPGFIEELPNFSGKQISGLTVDFDHGVVYWLTQDSTRLEIYQADLVKKGHSDGRTAKMVLFSDSLKTSQHALQYYCGRLIWINEEEVLQIVELERSQAVHISRSVSVTAFTVVNPKPLPVEDLSVPCYCVSGLEPFTEFDVAVKSYTYWGSAEQTRTSLRSPEAAPSAPENPRIYMNPQRNVQGDIVDTEVEFRWNKPAHPNGVLRGYTVFYTTENCPSIAERGALVNVSADTTTFKIHGADPEKNYCVQVGGFTNAGSSIRTPVLMGNATATESVPYLLAIKDKGVVLLDMDTSTVVQKMPVSAVKDMGYIKRTQRLYYLTENMIMSTSLDGKHQTQLIESVLSSVPGEMTVDWIGRKLYMVLDLQEGTSSSVCALDLEVRGAKLEKLVSSSERIHSIGIYPQKSLLFWTQSLSGNIALVSYSLIDRLPRTLLTSHVKASTSAFPVAECNCSVARLQLDGNFAVDTTEAEPERVFFTTQHHEIWASDLNGCRCWKKMSSPESTDVDRSKIYTAAKSSGDILSVYRGFSLTKVVPYDEQSQPYSDLQCLMPKVYTRAPQVLNRSDTSLLLHIPSVEYVSVCSDISKPTPTYTLHFAELQDSESDASCTHGIKCYKQEVQTNTVWLNELQPYTRYLMQVSVKTRYGDVSGNLGPPAVNWTWFGVPSAPRLVEALVLSDSRVEVSWSAPLEPNGPVEELRYQVQYQGNNYWPSLPMPSAQLAGGRRQIQLANLHSGTEYWFQVLSFPPAGRSFSRSEAVLRTTFQAPVPPSLLSVGNTTVTVLWQSLTDGSVRRQWFEISQDTNRETWKEVSANCSDHGNASYLIPGLHPSRTYFLRAAVTYVTNTSSVSTALVLGTQAGKPGRPGTPNTFQDVISWAKAEDNGSNITHYILQARNSQNDTELVRLNSSDEWITLYQGPCNSTICTWRNQHFSGFYHMRVVAVNRIGTGQFSDISGEIVMKLYEPSESQALLVLGTVCVTIIFAVCCVFTAVYAQYTKRSKQKGDITTLQVNYNPDLELALIRDMNASVIQTNIWYTSSCLPTQLEHESLPLFPREKLTLLNFLGSGAFGEVFEGKAEEILGAGSGDVKVAVKTLRKGATDNEKSEFLKEAYLMSHFDHAHIIKLLGVCLQNEPQFLLLELMEGKDLLSYLRGARGSLMHHPLLHAGDLIDVCLDIAKGCSYLEKMHFVHRDLAARNCLVSTKEYNNSNRMVKIGDFGLARDIYKNDYYRKEGEGLLPVRWMAPESLIDGLFTNQSDVWSFGILMWEVMTLGQQPYPARTNLEVLHFVRTGGRLERPHSCPDDLWNLMLKCWAREPHKRPSFRHIQSCLEHLKSSPQGSLNALVYYNDSYSNSDISQGIVNQAFEGEECQRQRVGDQRSSGVMVTSVADEEGSDLHYVSYRPAPRPGSRTESIGRRSESNARQEGTVNYAYIVSEEDREPGARIENMCSLGDLDGNASRQGLATCAATDSAHRDTRRYSVHRAIKHPATKSQQPENKSISAPPVESKFPTGSVRSGLDGVASPFLCYATVEWESTTGLERECNGVECAESGLKRAAEESCVHAPEISDASKSSVNPDGGLESKALCGKNAGNLINSETVERPISQCNPSEACAASEDSDSVPI